MLFYGRIDHNCQLNQTVGWLCTGITSIFYTTFSGEAILEMRAHLLEIWENEEVLFYWEIWEEVGGVFMFTTGVLVYGPNYTCRAGHLD